MCLAYVTTSTQHASLQITASCPASIKHSSLQLPRDSSVTVPQIQMLILKVEAPRDDHAMNRLSYTPVAINVAYGGHQWPEKPSHMV